MITTRMKAEEISQEYIKDYNYEIINNKIDFKKSFVSFTEYRCKDVPVKKDKKFGAFKKYLENKKMKRTWFLPGLFNCKVSVA